MSLRDDCEISTERSRAPGGQQVAPDPLIITVKHKPTGITVTLPPQRERSQHKRMMAALDAIEYLLETA